MLEVCSNNYLVCNTLNNDTDTNFESAMSGITNIMVTPGTGATTSTPQEVLFLVTNGVDNEVNNQTCVQYSGRQPLPARSRSAPPGARR